MNWEGWFAEVACLPVCLIWSITQGDPRRVSHTCAATADTWALRLVRATHGETPPALRSAVWYSAAAPSSLPPLGAGGQRGHLDADPPARP